MRGFLPSTHIQTISDSPLTHTSEREIQTVSLSLDRHFREGDVDIRLFPNSYLGQGGGRRGQLPFRHSTTSHEDDSTSLRPAKPVGLDAVAPLSEPSAPRSDMDTTYGIDTQASTSTVRSGCGATKNMSLKKHLDRRKQQIRINILPGYTALLNDWCTSWTQELDIICRQYAPITAFIWPQVTQEQRIVLYIRILEEFDMDILEDDREKRAVDIQLCNKF
ncbi:uncharacterized protein LOC131161795 isoform X2 [Malania oleifera]|uniref:uncharacterized protein LOC131161795 isoform X2 n=1 Tax=Malania oleifera TaxID=397392 RepID=UPI0025AEA6AA|nr:uncharacterized protein LOC131161795 isoform X2 [Malania oleifera]XP_057973749.1 uncharacterized protein LOC131161795 isoform X2 [Malania oleifera]